MSCIAKIKSPVTGKTVNSPAYYQLTSFFSQTEGKKIYEAMTTDAFKGNFGFDWTKPHIGVSTRVNYAGEPRIREINKHLNLKLTEDELQAAEQIDEIGVLGYIGTVFETPLAFDNIGMEIQLNPKFDMINYEVLAVEGGYQLSVKPKVGEKKEYPIRKELLERFQFPQFVIDSVQDFNNATFKELIDNLASNAELEPFQQEILKKLSPLMGKNPTLKLAIFDDINVSDEYQRSFYDPKSNTVYIAKSTFTPTDDKFLAREIIHETIHAFTLSILNNPRTEEEIRFVREIEGYFSTYQTYHPELQDYYAFKNVEEFVAEFLSNPYFREQLQVAESQKKPQAGFISQMWNSIKSFLNRYVFGDMGSTMFDQVQETLDDYFDYLMTLQDYPESVSENQIRFSQPFQNRDEKPTVYNTLKDFYDYIDNSVDSSIWNQLMQNLGEVGGKESVELRAINRLQDTFGKISSSDIKSSLIASGQYAEEVSAFVTRLKRDLEILSKGTSYYTPEVILKKLNSAILIAQTLREQIEQFQGNLVDKLTFSMFADFELSRELEVAAKRLALKQEVPKIEQYKQIIEDALGNAMEAINAIENKAKNSMLDPVAEVASRMFVKIAADMQNPEHPIQKELATRKEQLAKAEANGNKKLVANLQKEIEDINKALGFRPTPENIRKLLSSATDQAMGNETTFTRFLNVGGFSGVPLVDVVNTFINEHITQATNSNLEKDAKIRDLELRIRERNRKKGIGKNILQNAKGLISIKTSSTRERYEGFFRVVPVKYYDKEGNVKIVTQKVYNTPMKEVEFQNDLGDLKFELNKARKAGDADKILEAETNLNTFLEDYAQREFVDEYYIAEKLLTDDAREARAEILKEIENYSSVFGDDDLDTEVTNSVRGSSSEKNPTIREVRASLRRQYVRLGSIYGEDGTEKPIGSKERDIAESIVAYNKARKELDVVEFVVGEETLTKFTQIKDQFKSTISELQAQISELLDNVDEAVQANDIAKVEYLQSTIFNKKKDLEQEQKRQKDWLDANSRVEIKPEFFEMQQQYSNQVRDILSKYGENPEVTEKYERLFSAVKGFRDQDGMIQGNLVGEGLSVTVKEIEQSIENLKKKIKEDSNISEQDQLALGEIFKKLYGLQSKVTTAYYGETVQTIKNKLESSFTQEERNKIFENSEALAKAFMANGNQFTDELLGLFKAKNFQGDEFFAGRNAEDFEEQNSDKEAIVGMFKNVLTNIELNKRLRATDWYKNNHIEITYEIKTEDFVMTPDGTLKPLTRTITETRPTYIWRKTIPNDEKFIKRDSPSFDWATPRIRAEYKNPNYRFLGDTQGEARRPRTDAKDNKYVNPEYTRLNPEEKGIMDDIISIYEEDQRSMPSGQRLKGYVMPNVSKDTKEESVDFFRPLYKMYNWYKSFSLFFKENIAGQGDEEIELDIVEARKKLENKGKSKNIRLIKTRYKQPIADGASTDNILQALAAYSTYAAEFRGLQKALPTVFALRDTYAEKGKDVRAQNTQEARTVWQKFKKGSKRIGGAFMGTDASQQELIVQQLDDQIARFFYGAQLKTGNNALSRVFTRSINHLTNLFQKYTLRYNLMRMAKNVIANLLNSVGNSSKFGLSKQNMLKGTAKAALKRSELIGLEQGIDKMSPYLAKLVYFRAIPLADPTNIYRSINSGFLTRYLNVDNFSAQWFSSNEAISTLGIYEAFMEKTYVDFTGPNTPVGYKIKLADAYDYIDGVLVPKDGVFGINRTKLKELVSERNNYILKFLSDNAVTNSNQLPVVKKVQLAKELESKFGASIKAEEVFIGKQIEKLQEVEREVRDQMFQLYTATQGNYARRGKSYYQSVVWLKALMTMKSWLFPQASNLYGGKKFSITTGRLDQGMYSTVVHAMRRSLLGLRTQGASIAMDYQFTEREREASARVAFNMTSMTTLYLLTHYIGNVAMEALKGKNDDEEDMDWWKYLLAQLALGALDESASLNPAYLPAVQYNKIKTDPLKKPYEEKGFLKSALRVAGTVVYGQQINTIDKILEGYGLLGEYAASIPRDAYSWFKGEGTFADVFNEPYYEMSAGGEGYKVANARVKINTGESKFFVGLSKVTGIEVGIKALDSKNKFIQQVAFSPAPGLTNPIGRLNVIDAKIDKIMTMWYEKRPSDIKFIEDNTKIVELADGTRKIVKDPVLKTFLATTTGAEDRKKWVVELTELQKERDQLISYGEGYSYLRKFEENKRVAQKFGRDSKQTVDDLVEAVTGYSRPKFKLSIEAGKVEKEGTAYLKSLKNAQKQQFPEIKRYYDSIQNLDAEKKALLKQNGGHLLPE